MRDLQTFQIDMYKRMNGLEKNVEDGLVQLAMKCDKMEKIVSKYIP